MTDISAGRLSTIERAKQTAKARVADDEPPEIAHPKFGTKGPQIIVAIAVCGAVLWAAQAVIVPTVLGAVLALVLNPIVGALERLRIPTGIAAVGVVLTAVALLAGTAMAVAPSVAEWVRRAPEFARAIDQKAEPIKNWLASVQSASSQIDKITNVSGTPEVPAAPAPSTSPSFLETAPTVLAQAIYVIALALFLTGGRKVYRSRLILMARSRENRLRVARILNEALDQVSGYLFTMMCVSIGLAVVTTVAFMIAGVEYALLWGVAFGIASIIPYLGPTVVIVLCAAVQFVTKDTLSAAAVAPILLLAINTIESNFVTPYLVSRRTAVSALGIFVTLAVFIWLWGPAASILAVPVLILFHAIARHVPALQAYAVLLQAENDTSTDTTQTARQKFFAAESEQEATASKLSILAIVRRIRLTPWWKTQSEETPPSPAAIPAAE